MPSYAQLEAEPWWSREIVTDELDWLGDELCRRLGRPRNAFGAKGNNVHLNGGHRSQEWIKNSQFCDNDTYTVESGLTETQSRHIAACDFTPGVWGTAANRQLVAQQTRALWDAAKAGQLPGVTQVLGTLDGRNPIGLNVASGGTFRPDRSHLDHFHLTIGRKRMRDKALMQRIAATVLNGGSDDMTPDQASQLAAVYQAVFQGGGSCGHYAEPDNQLPRSNSMIQKMDALLEAEQAEQVELTPEQLAAIATQAGQHAAAAIAGKLDALFAAMPKPPTAKEVADLLAARLAQ